MANSHAEFNTTFDEESCMKSFFCTLAPSTFSLYTRLVPTARSLAASSSFFFLALCVVLCINSCTTVPSSHAFLPEIPTYQRVQSTNIPYPILLLHGLGQKSHVWDEHAVDFYKRDMGLSFGGILSMNKGVSSLNTRNASGSGADFYTVTFTSPHDSVNTWARELEQHIALVRKKTGCDDVILIGYSMGGLASRAYLTQHLRNHHVKRLITIGTPHLGSAFARVWALKSSLTSQLQNNPSILMKPILNAALSAVTAAEQDVPFDAPAVHDLQRPEDGGMYLDALGKAEHPADVDYVCVVGDVDVASEVQKLNTTAVQEILRRAIEFLGSGVSAVFSTGDGVVSAYSQNITNIPFFKSSASRSRLARTITLGSLHVDHLRNSSEIQRVTLEDKPQYLGAEVYTINDKASLVIDYTDFLTVDKSVVNVTYTGVAGDRTIIAPTAQLVRINQRDIVHRTIIPLEGEINFSSPITFRISIKNYFGNTATATKQWSPPVLQR